LLMRVCHLRLSDGSHIFSLWDSCSVSVSSFADELFAFFLILILSSLSIINNQKW
jgi:hypothetical protein